MAKQPRFNLRTGIYFSQGSRVFKLWVWYSGQGDRCEFANIEHLNEKGEVDDTKNIIHKTAQEMVQYMDDGLIAYIGTTRPRG
ncbi:MAG TPA: hypothetical protein PLU58_07385 [Saprospiraceae bacterium]|nr:hypothetical protein [Saprospiraceae bacterium]